MIEYFLYVWSQFGQAWELRVSSLCKDTIGKYREKYKQGNKCTCLTQKQVKGIFD